MNPDREEERSLRTHFDREVKLIATKIDKLDMKGIAKLDELHEAQADHRACLENNMANHSLATKHDRLDGEVRGPIARLDEEVRGLTAKLDDLKEAQASHQASLEEKIGQRLDREVEGLTAKLDDLKEAQKAHQASLEEKIDRPQAALSALARP